MEIRQARTGDEAEIANVHVSSWREAYKDLLPQEFLDSLPLTFKRRMNSMASKIPDRNYYINVACDNSCVVGFACFSASRSPEFLNFGEVQAIYLLQKYKGKGTGYRLLKDGFKYLSAQSYKKAFCWVLENNPTIRFYEKTGARFSGQEKMDQIGGQTVRELAYVWEQF